MTLSNFVGISLKKITPDLDDIKRLITAAEQCIKDSKEQTVSTKIRFDAGYKAIFQIAKAALQIKGYRTLTNKEKDNLLII